MLVEIAGFLLGREHVKPVAVTIGKLHVIRNARPFHYILGGVDAHWYHL